MNDLNKVIGENLKNYRKRAGLTQKEAAERVSKSRTWLADIERGESAIFFHDFMSLAKLYNMTSDEITNAL